MRLPPISSMQQRADDRGYLATVFAPLPANPVT
jgi:hypothetical protein